MHTLDRQCIDTVHDCSGDKFGAAWNFQGKLLFTDNAGSGVSVPTLRIQY